VPGHFRPRSHSPAQRNSGLITISKYWQKWSDPLLIVLVLHNNDLNQVTWLRGDFITSP
jgi:hypothetical protein